MFPVFQSLLCWCDDVERGGPENMAVDEWLHETALQPVLRVYRWQPGWGSLGYFGALAEARNSFPELSWVRRWTGGGTVDHRVDWTYTLVVPTEEELATARGAESYRVIHAALAEVLPQEGWNVRLADGSLETGAASCFENPVCHDLVDEAGRKIAGAGQRRTRNGLLHQGSVSGGPDWADAVIRAERLSEVLSERWDMFHPLLSDGLLEMRVRHYADAKWTARR
ncbi:hypothetical protein KBB96_07145 [Luteolibacter ambystomatis]|uniref:BPL/LPL catalytic domain-containing protein n=1 Tax=Luteolibacter ambystomatis TaxID=2824561 RepID=A0A975J264_9BACT|nr:hypothetical protein [Luteolibacter ambystomatis]QUE52663.1 hypothetical protein KBB96_07145 [Luteolibacter ambystomatis]